jgi:hypothetical protein
MSLTTQSPTHHAPPTTLDSSTDTATSPPFNSLIMLINIQTGSPMVCYCIPITCSYSTNDEAVPESANYPDLPKDVICPRCGILSQTEYKKEKYSCTLCFCCTCPCGTGRPYVACSRCGYNYSGSDIRRCENCHVGSTFQSLFCPNCGQRNKF